MNDAKTEDKPEHSHGKYNTASQYRPGPTDTLPQVIARFGSDNLTVRMNHSWKAGQSLVLEEGDTEITVWSSSDGVSLDTVMELLQKVGVSKKYNS